jgi:hypothetical protein
MGTNAHKGLDYGIPLANVFCSLVSGGRPKPDIRIYVHGHIS